MVPSASAAARPMPDRWGSRRPSDPAGLRRSNVTKILFVNPRFPRSLWGFQGISDLVGVRSGQAPLGLATVAAMTPPEIAVELQDENCYPLGFDTDADLVCRLLLAKKNSA